MSKIEIQTYTAKSGKQFRSVTMADVFKALGMPEQAEIGCGMTPDGKTLLLWEPRAVKQAKANGVMAKPLATLAKPNNGGADDRLATVEKMLAQLLAQQAERKTAEAPVGTTITRRKKAA